MRGETYEEFVEKFKNKHTLTTDDCYTPQQLMEDITAVVCKEFNIDPATVIRPFYPGGDYESEDYTGKVVIDNPPFSIMTKILKFYREHNVKAFLFCPGLTSSKEQLEHWTTVFVNRSIIYENGANVATNFVHNFTPDVVATTCKELNDIVCKANPRRVLKAIPRGPGAVTIADFRTASRRKDFVIKKEDVKEINTKDYYSYALILDENQAAELLRKDD